jgi:cyclophilin family peptidyl-prolyl cis-trans isomerase
MGLLFVHRQIAMFGLVSVFLVISARADGIFADFITSKGNFTCQLDYTNAPKAVANFIGLAIGQRAWLEEATGLVKTNSFYNNLTFHRVIDKFMIQGGSPNGLGTDGPGYAVEDEFSSVLRHDAPGVLSMANSGPDSNGGQYFITVTNTPWLNDVHTVFGRVTAGMDVVYAISQMAVNSSSKPFTNVVVQQVSIRRVGTAAEAFNINAQGLPVVANLPLQITKNSGQVTLTFSNRIYADNRLCLATNLNQWSVNALGIETTTPLTQAIQKAIDVPRQFYAIAQIQYAASTLSPKNVQNQKLALTFITGDAGTITITFDASVSGTYTFPPGLPGTVNGYDWGQEPYRGRLGIGFTGRDVLILRLDFVSNGAGNFSGQAYPYYPYSFGAYAVTGTFTLSAP